MKFISPYVSRLLILFIARHVFHLRVFGEFIVPYVFRIFSVFIA